MQRPAYTETRPVAVMDTECFPNYWAIAFRDVATQRIKRFRKFKDEPLDRQGIATILRKWRIISFNGIRYDITMILIAMNGADNETLKRANDMLIVEGIPYWEVQRAFGVKPPEWLDHIDLAEPSPGSPGKPSLKLYAGRLHSRRMHELEIDFDEDVTEAQFGIIDEYHDDDLEVTRDFWFELKPQIEIRAKFSQRYQTDLRSKSDAQCAEAVFKRLMKERTGRDVSKPQIKAGLFKYKPPAYVKFKTPALQELLRKLTTSDFLVDRAGKVREPSWLKGYQIPLGGTIYTVGIGGLHSTEHRSNHQSDEDYVLLDRDVTSYYPSMILACSLYPPGLGKIFLSILRDLVKERFEAKAKAKFFKDNGRKEEARPWEDLAEFLKIVLNGIFGKMGQPGSIFYGPQSMVGVTITGQLSLLMAIEANEVEAQMRVISGNTDGFITKVPRDRLAEFMGRVFDWENETGLITEETELHSVYSRDVNTYIAKTAKGEIKRKGKLFTPAGPGLKGASGMKKNPNAEVCFDAVSKFLFDDVPLRDTIEGCTDFKRFICVGNVNEGGAKKDGVFVGKSLRWYYSTETSSAFHRVKNNNKVASTEGAMPCLLMPAGIPEDLDHDWYVRQATAILEDVGLSVVDPEMEGRTNYFFGRLAKQKTVHEVDPQTRRAKCGKRTISLRERWLETEWPPAEIEIEALRFCGKCKRADVY